MKKIIPMTLAALLLSSSAVLAQVQTEFDRIDGNGDGQVSFTDLTGAWPNLTQAQFDAADINSDDFLDLTEYTGLGDTMVEAEVNVGMASPSIDAPLFESLDNEGDGKISIDDLSGWPGVTQMHFDAADIDGDGFLDRTQYEGLKQHMAGAMGEPANVAIGLSRSSVSLPAFETIDVDGDNQIDFTTLKTQLPDLTQEQFDAADIDNDNFLDRTQYESLNL